MSGQPPPVRSPLVTQDGYITDIWQSYFTGLVTDAEGTPTGVIWPYSSAVPPAGWLVCNGQSLDRKKYINLYNVLGVVFGSDDATTFKVPDLTGRFIKGGSLVGTKAGAAMTTIKKENLPVVDLDVTDPQHSHMFTPTDHTHDVIDPGHNHTVANGTGTGTGGSATGDTTASTTNTSSSSTGISIKNAKANGTVEKASTGISVKLNGGAVAISNEPPSVQLAYIIKY